MHINLSKISSKYWRTQSLRVVICSGMFILVQGCINLPAYHSLDDPFTARAWYENKHGIDRHANQIGKNSPSIQSQVNESIAEILPIDLDAHEKVDNHQYRVKKSDTLFSIAYGFELDYRKLATANNINSPFIIFPGQILNIDAAKSISDSQVDKSITVVDLPEDFVAPIIEEVPAPLEQIVITPPENSNAVSKNTVAEIPPSQETVKKPTTSNPTIHQPSTWNWPAVGNIVRTFSDKGDINKGIDIQSIKGESVRVAATGTVVFAGTGPLGYGQLLIVQHDNQWLSAYSNLNKIVVKEKQIVKASEVIAEIGNDRSGNSILHFEIRSLGKPVDPMLYLPKL
ncbi:lipoprotein NlpD [Marinicellulosiphila megalodicopiae]